MRKTLLGLTALVLLFTGTQFSAAQPGALLAGIVAPPPAPIRLLALGGSGNGAANAAYDLGALTGTITRMYDPNEFNAISPVQLRASFDVILVCWALDGGFNLDWNARVLPFLSLGGGIVWEDPYNIADLAPGVLGYQSDNGGPYTITAAVPGLTDGIAGAFVNRHTAFSSWDPALQVFMMSNSETIGICGEFPGGGRIVLTGPDNDYHASPFGDSTEVNQYNFLVNEIRWAAPRPPSLINQLKVHVQALVTAGTLTKSYGAILISLLDSAQGRVNQGRNPAAITLIKSFISYVQKLTLPPGDKASLIAEANAVIAWLSGQQGN